MENDDGKVDLELEFDDDLIAELREEAERRGISLDQFIEYLLKRAMEESSIVKEKLKNFS